MIVFQSLVTDVMLTSGSLKTAIAAFLDVAPADILVARPPGACEHLGPQGSRLKLTVPRCIVHGQGRVGLHRALLSCTGGGGSCSHCEGVRAADGR